jgi:hypothetical protein
MSEPRGWLRARLARLGRALDPDAGRVRADIKALDARINEWRTRQDAVAEAHQARLDRSHAELESLAAHVVAGRRDLGRMKRLVTKQGDHLSRLVRLAALDQRAALAERRVRDRLARLARGTRPIVIGPWTGEVGFELLYWIPFVQWATEAFGLDPRRLLVLSRGGVQAWYGHITSQYEDAFRYVSPDRFHAAATDRKKQHNVRPFERDLLRQVVRARGLTRVQLLHPSLMYDAYKAFWRYDATAPRLEAMARFRRLPPVDLGAAAPELPTDFVAVRFYFSTCFPDTPANRALAAGVIEGLAARHDVVLLNNDIVVDDHRDFAPGAQGRVHQLTAHMQPETNLAVQTAVISRARAFVGTYGGYSYLAPLYGVNSVAYYSAATFKRHHVVLAQRAFQKLGHATVTPLDVARADLLGDVLGAASAVTHP